MPERTLAEENQIAFLVSWVAMNHREGYITGLNKEDYEGVAHQLRAIVLEYTEF